MYASSLNATRVSVTVAPSQDIEEHILVKDLTDVPLITVPRALFAKLY